MMERHGIAYFDYAGPDGALLIQADRPGEHAPIHAARSGVFLTRHPAETSELVWPRRVRPGTIVGWLRIGPMLEPVTATEDALIRRPCAIEGRLANLGDRLF